MNATRNETKRVIAEVERLTIPTYPEAPAETLPMFAENRVHQRTSGNPYPNAVVICTRSDEIEQREYTAIRLENEYIRLCILPELGGRIFTATDKSTGYDFFYRQHVIKPALIGALGSWISGGVEFNWPYHHRPSTFLPVDWSIEEEPDGSVTVWLSEHEPFDRMKGMAGVRLEPGRASFETRMKLFNRTPLRRSFLWWENAAVPVNEDYRIFFPPDVDHVYFHYRRDATSYPIAKGVFNGFDFGGEGVDISRHGSSLKSTSYFSAESKFDFFGGYDERAGRGVVHYADHHTSTGKKMFTWAYNQLSVSWERALTDTDGPYAELMAGSYTDNQPDFAWLEPYETKCFSQFWYPIADLGVPTYANGDAAVRMDGSRLYVQAVRAVDALVTVVSGDDTARIRRRLEPGRAVCLDLGFEAAEGYTVNIYEEAEGCKKPALLLRYTDEKYPEGERRTVGDLPLPGDFCEGTAHEYASPSAYRCYNAGIHVMQYRDPQYDPEPYFLRALGLDPDFAPAHTALGECLLRRGEYREAAKHLRKAIGLSGTLNRNPEDGRAWYLLGLALERNSPDDAYDAFHKAMWNEGCVSCAMTGAAAIAGRRSEWKTMREHALHALSCSAHNSTAAVYAAIAALRLGDRGTAVGDHDLVERPPQLHGDHLTPADHRPAGRMTTTGAARLPDSETRAATLPSGPTAATTPVSPRASSQRPCRNPSACSASMSRRGNAASAAASRSSESSGVPSSWSRVRATSSPNGPTAVRRSAVRCPPTPSASPRSRASARMYVPVEQSTTTTRSITPPSRLRSSTSNRDTVTRRDARTTSSPDRTMSYARRPATLMALTDEGTWSISPVSAVIPASIASSVTAEASVVAVISPSASSACAFAMSPTGFHPRARRPSAAHYSGRRISLSISVF